MAAVLARIFLTFPNVFSLEKLEDLYAFSYTPKDENLTRSAGWALFDIRSEYARMGLPSDDWFLNNCNKDYQVGLQCTCTCTSDLKPRASFLRSV